MTYDENGRLDNRLVKPPYILVAIKLLPKREIQFQYLAREIRSENERVRNTPPCGGVTEHTTMWRRGGTRRGETHFIWVVYSLHHFQVIECGVYA